MVIENSGPTFQKFGLYQKVNGWAPHFAWEAHYEFDDSSLFDIYPWPVIPFPMSMASSHCLYHFSSNQPFQDKQILQDHFGESSPLYLSIQLMVLHPHLSFLCFQPVVIHCWYPVGPRKICNHLNPVEAMKDNKLPEHKKGMNVHTSSITNF